MAITVAGTNFRAQDAAKAVRVLANHGSLPVRLEAEPTNQFDPFAVKVIVTIPGIRTEIMVGYIPRKKDINKRLLERAKTDTTVMDGWKLIEGKRYGQDKYLLRITHAMLDNR